jgi:transposase
MQLHRKDENIDLIQDKINQFEKKGQMNNNKMIKQAPVKDNSEEVKKLRAEIEEKNRQLAQYQMLI